MKQLFSTNSIQKENIAFDESFLDDALELFFGTRGGHVGKYIYEDKTSVFTDNQNSLWKEVLLQENPAYYLPKADNDLLKKALSYVPQKLPHEIPIIDFGIGGIEAFEAHILPFLKALGSSHYVGLDVCKDYITAIRHFLKKDSKLTTLMRETDFFSSYQKPAIPVPSLGVITCGTIGNIYGSINDQNVSGNLKRSLENVARATKNGWLLISVDTNQNPDLLMEGYVSPIMEELFLTVLHRIANELPTVGFNPNLFRYAPEWHPDIHLFAHMAEATEDQDFTMGAYRLQVRKGQKLHLLNSYKFPAAFFESCCDKANLEVLNVWHHESPMKLYLLIDRANPAYAAQKQKIAAA